jgi:hypothetical protein
MNRNVSYPTSHEPLNTINIVLLNLEIIKDFCMATWPVLGVLIQSEDVGALCSWDCLFTSDRFLSNGNMTVSDFV